MGFFKKLFGRKEKAVLDYRGQTGNEDSPLKKYPKDIAKIKARGETEVSIWYGNRNTGYSRMESVSGRDYLLNLRSLEKRGHRVMSVDDETGIVRRLRPAGKNFVPRSLPDFVERDGETYEIYDSPDRDRRGSNVSYVIRQRKPEEIETEDRGNRLNGYLHEILRKENEIGGAVRIGRNYLERKLKELEAVSGAKVRKLDGKEYYVNVTRSGKIIRYLKQNVDFLLRRTREYLDVSGGPTIERLTERELRKRVEEKRKSEKESSRSFAYPSRFPDPSQF